MSLPSSLSSPSVLDTTTDIVGIEGSPENDSLLSPSSAAPSSTPDAFSTLSKEDLKAAKKQKRKQFAEKATFATVLLDNTSKTVTSISGQCIKNWTAEMLRQFLRANGVRVPNARKEELLDVIYNHISMKETRNTLRTTAFSSIGKKKPAVSTKPAALKSDGSIYRAIIAILHPSVKDAYLATGAALSREQLDSRKGHNDSWIPIHTLYLSDDKDLDVLGETSGQVLYSHAGVSVDLPSTFDKLSLSEFIATVKYINHHFNSSKNRNNTSGQHGDFVKYIDGKVWLYFYWARMEEIGNLSYGQLAHAELPMGAMVVSSKGVNAAGAGPDPKSIKGKDQKGNKKNSANNELAIARKESAEATKAAADAAATKSLEIADAIKSNSNTMKFKRLTELIGVRLELTNEVETVTKSNNKQRKRGWKSRWQLMDLEYKRLKKDLNYDSPPDTDDESCEDGNSNSSLDNTI